MLKTYWPVFALLLVLLAVLGVSCYTYPCNECEQNSASQATPAVGVQNKPNESPRKANHAERAKFWVMKTVAWPDGITALLILLTLVGITCQSCETRKAAEATQIAVRTADKALALQEATAKRQLRAYMVVRDAHLILHEDGAVEAKVELVNCGQTPAYDLRGAMICKFTVYPVRDMQPMQDDLRKSAGTLGAGLGNWLLYPVGRHDKGNREHLLGRFNEVKGLVYYAHGHYAYRDTFNDPHWLKFQLIVGGPAGLRVDSDGIRHWASFSYDSEGNEEDQYPQNPN